MIPRKRPEDLVDAVFRLADLGVRCDFFGGVEHLPSLNPELARTIGTLGSVQNARVHLVLPERSVFTANRENATASVVLKLRQGRSFSKGEVASVLHLVAAAVPGLNAERVAIVSSDGSTLHRPKEEGGALAEGDAQVEKEREMALGLENQARAILDRAVGPGHVEIRARVELDSATTERTEEHYDPAKAVVRSEQENIERSGEGAAQASVSGIPGASSAMPSAQAPTPDPEPGLTTGLAPGRKGWGLPERTFRQVAAAAAEGSRRGAVGQWRVADLRRAAA